MIANATLIGMVSSRLPGETGQSDPRGTASGHKSARGSAIASNGGIRAVSSLAQVASSSQGPFEAARRAEAGVGVDEPHVRHAGAGVERALALQIEARVLGDGISHTQPGNVNVSIGPSLGSSGRRPRRQPARSGTISATSKAPKRSPGSARTHQPPGPPRPRWKPRLSSPPSPVAAFA